MLSHKSMLLFTRVSKSLLPSISTLNLKTSSQCRISNFSSKVPENDPELKDFLSQIRKDFGGTIESFETEEKKDDVVDELAG